MTESKPHSWAKHAVRKWIELYYEILKADGQVDLTTPLSALFSPDFLLAKISDTPLKSPAKPIPTKQKNNPFPRCSNHY